MKIIKATEEDLKLIQELAEKSWHANYVGIISTEQIDYMLGEMYSEKELKNHFENPNYHYFLIGDVDGEFHGIMGFEISYEPETTKLHRIYLLKESKGKGLGKAAIDFLKNMVQQYGNKRIILNVNKQNPAKDFYESQGFKVYQETVLDVGKGFVMDDYLMEYYC